ncbi:hypothetical protein PRZ48_002151 [Zasmidium cellare]|uniref:SWR1-complex protein 3 domain-containing protein n=1 Tax=Zasmidium cellare TaxID=395010 RepID=A0ABR0F4J8_ZASCE|nr:hypothetical protein PRZ48_002151 [Zasmidium cellare]
MAQTQPPIAGQKRGPGRPPRSAAPAAKKQKIAAPTPPSLASPITRSPAVDSPAPEKRGPRLPAKIVDSKPLPSLREPQSLSLSNDEYQSIAASAVLPCSLERSRQKWVHDGIFEKYWVKPEQVKAGKPSKPLPPNNPDGKLQKHKGECRIRIEPHMLVAEVYVEEKGKPPAPAKQYVQNHGQPYRAPQQPYQNPQPNQSRTLPPPTQNSATLPPIQQQPQRSQPASSPAPAQQQDKKAQPDPVISMLANRASSDSELKALMKEVATGNATQDQLKIFQKHIDELTAIIQKQKKDEEDRAARELQQANMIQYDGAADAKPQAPAQQPNAIQPQQPQPQQPRPPHAVPQPPAPNYQNQQPTWTPPPPTNMPVVLQFTTQGGSEDRFLFPQHSILESLSPQHLLVSFILTRKGREAVDATGLEPDKEYWQPITMMIEVAYGREEIMNCIRRWCKPAEEVRKHMEDTMSRCQRAPESFLALRLPFKSTATTESEDVSKEATPTLTTEKPKAAKSSVKYVKKAVTASGKPNDKQESNANDKGNEAASTSVGDGGNAAKDEIVVSQGGDGAQPESNDSGRPRRATRKSVRISEAKMTTSPAPVVYINGYPGVGKFTTAKALQRLIPDSVLIDNHQLIDPVEKIYSRGSPLYLEKRAEERRKVLSPIAHDSKTKDTVYIFTDSQIEYNDCVRDYSGLALPSNGNGARHFYSVVLECEFEENVRRLTAAERGGEGRTKLKDTKVLREIREQYSTWKFEEGDELVLDVTKLDAEEAAMRIKEFFDKGLGKVNTLSEMEVI